jgi:hypothetical protein
MALFFQYPPGDGRPPQPNLWAFVGAGALVAVLAGLALWAEYAPLPKATENLWTAFQTVLGVFVGFIGGEAIGFASAKTK